MPTDPNEILMWFRAMQDSRYALTSAFVVDGYLYATDGFICARMRCEEPDTEGNWPPVALLKWGVMECSSVLISLPPIETIPPDPSPTICTHCHGTGEIETVECGCCENGILHPPMPAMLVDGLEIALNHVRLLATHGAILFATLHQPTPGKARAAYFKIGDEIEGLVAVRKPGDSVIVEPMTPNPGDAGRSDK